VAEEFGVEGGHHHRRPLEPGGGKPGDLGPALVQEMPGVLGRPFACV
jgi:hypothetical protein